MVKICFKKVEHFKDSVQKSAASNQIFVGKKTLDVNDL